MQLLPGSSSQVDQNRAGGPNSGNLRGGVTGNVHDEFGGVVGHHDMFDPSPSRAMMRNEIFADLSQGSMLGGDNAFQDYKSDNNEDISLDKDMGGPDIDKMPGNSHLMMPDDPLAFMHPNPNA